MNNNNNEPIHPSPKGKGLLGQNNKIQINEYEHKRKNY